MLVAMTTMLVSVAELSNVLSVLAILVCFCAMFLLIMRNMTVFWLHGEDFMFSSSVHHVQQRIPQMKMMKVHIPFTFKLQESSTASYTGVKCTISSQVPYRLQAFWGVSIRELHLFLWRPWSCISSALQQDNLLSGYYQYKGHSSLEKESHAEKTVEMILPDGCLDLGTPPRLYYPLVILLIRDNPNVLPDETVALVNVVHIKDSVCTLPTSILAQYLKQANGQLSSLKQLYLATGNSLTYDDNEPKDRGAVIMDNNLVPCEQQLCVVCQYFPLSRALLPCRHTCICASCFAKLENCPMCRSPIKSYFCVRGEEYLTDCSNEKTVPSKPERLSQWVQENITDLFGFHR
ncbi:cell growth regulator with RING finger domain protein 1-like isoform X2 [Planococcus citri]|uniref:cell growth regulator with RING finger domain protein 1-like isoform X2 n=1 Tax=Planococcus citri TaxID=170843 RepID=UPI0031F7D162